MPQVLIKKFTLRHNGQEYKAGTIIELTEAEADALVTGAPKEFEKVVVRTVEVAETSEGVEDKALNEYTNAELQNICDERGIAVPKNANKAKLVELIEAALAEEEENNLPPINAAATVK